MMFDFFKRKGPEKPVRKTVEKPIKTRRFAGAAVTPNNKFLVSYSKINAELRSDLIALVLRAR